MMHLLFLCVVAWSWIIAAVWNWKALTTTLGLQTLPDLLSTSWDSAPHHGPPVTVIVPARNEEKTIEAGLRSLLTQDYTEVRIIAVDDRSTDNTGTIMRSLAAENPGRLSVITISELPSGWLGKTHAMHVAAAVAQQTTFADWLLFTDADVVFAPSALRRSMAAAVAAHADHFVTVPTPVLRRFDEDAFLAFFQVMSFLAVRLWRVNDAASLRDSIGVGAFALVRNTAYRKVGGFESLRMEILEDLYFGRRIKELGLSQRTAFGHGLVNIHWASGAGGIVDVLTKNLFAVFRYRLGLLVFSAAWLLFLAAGPFAGFMFHATRLASIASLFGIVALYRLARRYSGFSLTGVLFAPLAALLLAFSLLRSSVLTLLQGGVWWRGTFYSLQQLQQNAGPLLPQFEHALGQGNPAEPAVQP